MVRYNVLLDKALRAKQGEMTQSDISQACEVRYGVKVPETDLPKMRRQKDPKPPYKPLKPGEVGICANTALARVLDMDERQYVLACAIEHTPEPVMRFVGWDLAALVVSILDNVRALQEREIESFEIVKRRLEKEQPGMVPAWEAAREEKLHRWDDIETAALAALEPLKLFREVYGVKTGETPPPIDPINPHTMRDATRRLIGLLARTAEVSPKALQAAVTSLQVARDEHTI